MALDLGQGVEQTDRHYDWYGRKGESLDARLCLPREAEVPLLFLAHPAEDSGDSPLQLEQRSEVALLFLVQEEG